MSDEKNIVVVIKARDYRLAEPMLDALASEFMGYRTELMGAIDDIHYEFTEFSHRDLFMRALNSFKV